MACRTAHNHSWKNPIERIMSLLNIGLQCVGLMRGKMSDDFESAIKSLQLRQACGDSEKQYNVAISLKPAVDLLSKIFQ